MICYFILIFANSIKILQLNKFEELEVKDTELRNLHVYTEKTVKIQTLNDMKMNRELTNLKKNLMHERNLKLDAFQKVDDLQSQVFDLEDELTNIVSATRPQTGVSTKSNQLKVFLSAKFALFYPNFLTE